MCMGELQEKRRSSAAGSLREGPGLRCCPGGNTAPLSGERLAVEHSGQPRGFQPNQHRGGAQKQSWLCQNWLPRKHLSVLMKTTGLTHLDAC